MNPQDSKRSAAEKIIPGESFSLIENVLEKRLEDIVTFLSSESQGESKLYEEILSMFERILIKIALRRSNYVKSTAASFLGINRNTLHNKIEKLKINIDRE